MADFITRLAERALGIAPVVQPVIPSVFAPEPIGHPTSSEWASETTTSPGDPDRTRVPSTRKNQSGDALSSATPKAPRGTPESRPGPSHLSESRPSERGAMTGKEDQRGSSRTPARYPQTPPETRSETLQRAEPGPTRRGLPLAPPSVEDESGEAVFRPLGTRLDRGQGETLPPLASPGAQRFLDASEDTLGFKATLDRRQASGAPLVTPRIVRPQFNG